MYNILIILEGVSLSFIPTTMYAINVYGPPHSGKTEWANFLLKNYYNNPFRRRRKVEVGLLDDYKSEKIELPKGMTEAIIVSEHKVEGCNKYYQIYFTTSS